jgi:hypothetical protein
VAELRDVRARREAAPDLDASRYAQWVEDGEQGDRPRSLALDLDATIVEQEVTVSGLAIAAMHVAEKRAAWIERNRDRLANVAGQQREQAHARLVALLDEVEHTRSALHELRVAEMSMRAFGDDLGAVPDASVLLGGRSVADVLKLGKPAGATAPNRPQLQAARVLDLLREDARWLSSMGRRSSRTSRPPPCGHRPSRVSPSVSGRSTPRWTSTSVSTASRRPRSA